MRKKKDLEIRCVVKLDRSLVEKSSVNKCVEEFKRTCDLMVGEMVPYFKKIVIKLKKTGKLRWPSVKKHYEERARESK